MSLLTKLFVVLLVICDLLLCGAVAVFVNRVDDYKQAADKSKASFADMQGQMNTWKTEFLAQKSRNDALLGENGKLTYVTSDLMAQLAKEKTDRATDVSDMRKLIALAEQRTLAAQEESKYAAQRSAASEAREEKHIQNINDLNLAVSKWQTEYQAKAIDYEILDRNYGAMNEDLAQYRMKNEALAEIVQRHNISVDAPRAPDVAIEGRITRVDTVGGKLLAGISVGRNDRVTEGMKFFVTQPGTGTFLADLVVEKAEATTASGFLSGLKPQDVKKDCIVKTKMQ